MDGQIDYSQFTRAELNDALRSVDRDRYPKNYANIVHALSQPELPAPKGTIEQSAPPTQASAATPLPERLVAPIFGGSVLVALVLEYLYVKSQLGSVPPPGAGTVVGVIIFLAVAISAFQVGCMARQYDHSFKSVVISALVSWSAYVIWGKILGTWLGFGALAVMAAVLGWRGGMVGGVKREGT